MFGNGQEQSAILNPQYATDADFCRIFKEEMGSLYSLAYLLTTNHASAEQCFIASVEDAFKENAVFRNWAFTWSKRTVIKNAIKISNSESAYSNLERVNWGELPQNDPRISALITAVNRLTPLERFVFVLSALEGYPDRDCAILLSCTTKEVRRSRVRALQMLPAYYSERTDLSDVAARLPGLPQQTIDRVLLSLG
jgi:DNA-directed RNA polymerase specialized sigma24 family protein